MFATLLVAAITIPLMATHFYTSSVPSSAVFDQVWMTVPFIPIPTIVAVVKAIFPLFVLQASEVSGNPLSDGEQFLLRQYPEPGFTPRSYCSPASRRLNTFELLLPGPREGHPLRAGHC